MGIRTPKLYINNLGAISIKLTNRTGAPSVKGSLLELSSTNDFSVINSAANVLDPIGVFLDSGVPDGADAWVSILAMVEGLYDVGGASRDNWCGSGNTASRIDGSNISPPSATVHFQEFGHAATVAPSNGLGSLIVHTN